MSPHAACTKKALVFVAVITLMVASAVAATAGSLPPEVKTLPEPCARVDYCTDHGCMTLCKGLGYPYKQAKCKVDQGKYYCCCDPKQILR